MLKLNLPRVFSLRQIASPHLFMVKNGIPRATAWNLLRNSVHTIKNDHLEKICEMLNCQPNDLYEWKPAADTADAENHPLSGLRRAGTSPQIDKLIRELPLDKIQQAEQMLADLKDGE